MDNALHTAQILLPRAGIAPEKWAVVACDQFTAQPEYWRKADALVGQAPSTLRLFLPEAWLVEGEVNPGTLNAWLSENGAYDASGSLNWQRAAGLLGVSLTQRQPGWGVGGTLEMLIRQEVYPVARVKQPGTGAYHDVLLVGSVHGEFQIMDPLDPSGEPNSLSVYGNRIYEIRYLK